MTDYGNLWFRLHHIKFVFIYVLTRFLDPFCFLPSLGVLTTTASQPRRTSICPSFVSRDSPGSLEYFCTALHVHTSVNIDSWISVPPVVVSVALKAVKISNVTVN